MNSELWYQLPPDMQTWNTAVIENISRKIPEIPNYISAITWSKLDPATGDGDGLVEFLGGMGAAPIIIRANKLAPVDVIATNANGNTKFYPLSPLFLQKIYADNVIGEPVMNQTDRDESYEGPGKRIQHIKTVDGVKYASKECAQYLLDEITKSASVANWMVERMPETLVALYEKATEVEKVAAPTVADLPELTVAWKEGNSYFINDESVDAATINDFCKFAGASDKERSDFMVGVPIVRDNREKIAAIVIPTEQEATAMRIEDGEVFSDDAPVSKTEPNIAMTTAIMKDGTAHYGIVFSNQAFNNCGNPIKSNTVPNHSATPNEAKVTEDYCHDSCLVNNSRELFISTEGYGFNSNIKTNVRVELPSRTLYNMSEPSSPAIGMLGIIMTDYSPVDFGRIEEVVHLGNYILVRLYSYLSHNVTVHRMQGSTAFFEVVDNQLQPAYIDEKVDNVSMTGVNGIVRRGNDGNIVIDGVSHSVVNCPYALMQKYAAAYDDAVAIRDIALEHGKCEFEVFEPAVKTAAENDNADKTKDKKKSEGGNKDTKGTKSGTDDEQNGDPNGMSPIAPQLSGQSPESMMSVDLENDPNMGFGTGEPYASPAGPAPNGYGGVPAGGAAGGPAVVGAPAGYSTPVTSRDMENIVQINSPQVMDAYLMSNVANDNLANRETIMRTSDSVLRALEHLSQLLFLIRQGNMDFVSENDVQVAIAKLTDVAQSLGISNSQVGV